MEKLCSEEIDKLCKLLEKKCEFYRECEYFDKNSKICNNGGGNYCGTYRKTIRNCIVCKNELLLNEKKLCDSCKTNFITSLLKHKILTKETFKIGV